MLEVVVGAASFWHVGRLAPLFALQSYQAGLGRSAVELRMYLGAIRCGTLAFHILEASVIFGGDVGAVI